MIDKDISAAARALRAIPSERRAQASRDNGAHGGRPPVSRAERKALCEYLHAERIRIRRHAHGGWCVDSYGTTRSDTDRSHDQWTFADYLDSLRARMKERGA